MKRYFIYIMTNHTNTTLYVGVTNNLVRRIWEHKNGVHQGFTNKYHLTKLVYYEIFESIEAAITREKQLKAGSRQDKIDLIVGFNKDWNDLYEKIV